MRQDVSGCRPDCHRSRAYGAGRNFAGAKRQAEHSGHLGDDVGQSSISAYTFGLVGYRTPNIDWIAKEIFYVSDDGDLTALRYGDWKMVFMEQRAKGTLLVWANPFTPLRLLLLFHLRRDPYERATLASNTYYDWLIDRAYAFVPAQTCVGKFLQTFKESAPAKGRLLQPRSGDGAVADPERGAIET